MIWIIWFSVKKLRWRLWIFFLLGVVGIVEIGWVSVLFLGVLSCIFFVWNIRFVYGWMWLWVFILFMFFWGLREGEIGGFLLFMVCVVIENEFFFLRILGGLCYSKWIVGVILMWFEVWMNGQEDQEGFLRLEILIFLFESVSFEIFF